MAQKRQVTVIDDLNGRDITDAGENIPFSLDGVSYEIDLGTRNAIKLRKMLEPFIANGRRVSDKQEQRASVKSGAKRSGDTAAVRKWAKENGHQVAERGRIPTDITAAYLASPTLRSVS